VWRALLGLEETQAQPSLPVHPAVAQAKSVCEQLADRQLDIARLAEQSGLSASRLAHLFAEQLGITPLQYRNFARVQHFIRSYDGDERNLLRAALRAGFGSYAQFHRAFRQVCGEAPAVHFKWLANSARIDAKRTLGSTAELHDAQFV
jgi:AraC-like DNA-binding protein